MSIPSLSFIEPIFAWNVPLVSLIFLKRSLVFPILLFSSISLHWSLRKAFLSLLAILWNSAFRWVYLSLSCGSAGKESACNGGNLGSIPGLGRPPGKGKGYPLQYSGLENSLDCIVHGVTKSRTQLGNFLVFWLPLNHSLVSSKLCWILHSLLYRQICEFNSFTIGTRSNSKLPQRVDNLYCYFKQKNNKTIKQWLIRIRLHWEIKRNDTL